MKAGRVKISKQFLYDWLDCPDDIEIGEVESDRKDSVISMVIYGDDIPAEIMGCEVEEIYGCKIVMENIKENRLECPYCGHTFEILTIGHAKISCPKCGAFLKEEIL